MTVSSVALLAIACPPFAAGLYLMVSSRTVRRRREVRRFRRQLDDLGR